MQQNNRFVMEMNGIDVLLVQEATLPDIETNVLTYGNFAGLPDKKVAGKKKVGQSTFKKLRPSVGFDSSIRVWFQQTLVTGQLAYKRDIVIREINELEVPIASYIMEGCFPSKITHSGFKRGDDSELIMEEITLDMDDFYQLV